MINPLKISKKRGLSKEEKNDPIWSIIKFPVFILIVYFIFTSLLPISFAHSNAILISFTSLLVTAFSFGYIGYRAEKHSKNSKFSLKVGGYAGAIVGFILAIFNLFLVYFFPERFSYTLSEISSSLFLMGLSSDLAYKFLIISSWANLFLGTLFNALIGAFISWISALIFIKK